MAFQPAPDIVEVVIHATLNTKPVANVLHFKSIGAYDQVKLDNLVDDVHANVDGTYQQLINSAVSLTEITGRGLSSIIDISSAQSISVGVGTATLVALPPNQSFVATLRTGLTGRSARGRFYAFPSSSFWQDSNTSLSVDYATALATMLTNIKNGSLALGWLWCVLSRRSAGVLRATAIGTPITDVDIRNRTIDSMRSRLPQGH